MTVGELIGRLQGLDPNLPVLGTDIGYEHLYNIEVYTEDVDKDENVVPLERPFYTGERDSNKRERVKWRRCVALLLNTEDGQMAADLSRRDVEDDCGNLSFVEDGK